jgi:ABC-2 type transport system ATP-binding protein
MQLRIDNVSKTYPGGVVALQNVTLEISTGLFGLLGPNGAGKSSLMRTIATLQDADSGSITFDAIDVLRDKPAVRRRLGYLPQEFGVYPRLTPLQMLDHIAALKGIGGRGTRRDVVDELLTVTHLSDARRRKLGTFSGGMKQRFGIAMALIGDPKLVIVDEPTAGLDPEERNRFLNLLSSLSSRAVVILSTHIVDDVRELCTRMAIIDRGRVLLDSQPDLEIEALRGRIWKKVVGASELDAHLQGFRVLSHYLVAGRTEIRVQANDSPGPGFTPAEPDLRDVYFLTLRRHPPSTP